MVKKIVDVIDTLIFLWLAIAGFTLLWTSSFPKFTYAGCALVCTAVYWGSMNKDRVIATIEKVIQLFVKR